MLRLTLRIDGGTDGGIDAARWAARLRGATPADMHLVAAFLGDAILDIYIEPDADANVDAAIDRIVTALGASSCRASSVVALPVEAAATPTEVVPATQLTSVHRGEIVGFTVSTDCRDLTVKVRHRHYEAIDRLDITETDHHIHVTAWVGSSPDDPRGDYATFADTFTAVPAALRQPVGTRRISYDS
jgi:hypothetical protein